MKAGLIELLDEVQRQSKAITLRSKTARSFGIVVESVVKLRNLHFAPQFPDPVEVKCIHIGVN